MRCPFCSRANNAMYQWSTRNRSADWWAPWPAPMPSASSPRRSHHEARQMDEVRERARPPGPKMFLPVACPLFIVCGRKATVSGQVEYGIGEEVVAFLVLNHRGEGVTLGLAQGKFHIGKEAETGERLVHNLFHGESGSRGQGISTPDRVPTQRRLT